MICQELTRYIDAFLDDELSVMENLRVQAHMAFCGNCRAIVKSEITLRSLIEADALRDSAPDHLREKILCQISEQPQRPSGGFGRWIFLQRGFFAGLMAGAMAVALVFSLGVYFLKTSSESISPLVAEMVGKHQMYSRSEASLQVTNSDHHGVDSWLRQRVTFPLRVPILARSGERLIGARVSTVGDRQAAYLLYEIHGRRISVYVFESLPNDNLSGSSKVRAGTEFFSSNFDGFPVVWWENQELYYAAVSDHNVNDLVEFGLLCVNAMGL